MVRQIDEMLATNEDYKNILAKVQQAGQPTITMASLSRHYKNHYVPKNVKAVVWKTGQLCFEDGSPITHVSAIQYLEGIISLAARNIMAAPHRVGVRDALVAVELLLKIRQGLDKRDEFEEAWTEVVKKKGRHTRKVTVEEIVEEQAALPSGVAIEYDFGQDDEDPAP